MPIVALVCNDLGMGGTERGMATQALALDRTRFDLRVVCLGGRGPLADAIEKGGLRVDAVEGDFSRLVERLRGVDIAVHLRPGDAAPLLPRACRRASVPHMVDWNIFGKFDSSPDRRKFDCHLFISKVIALRYRKRFGTARDAFHHRHRVQSLPVDPRLRDRAPTQREARIILGLDPDRPVVGRTGRAHDIKWRNLLVDMVPYLLREAPDTQVVLVGSTPAKVRRLRRHGVLDRCTLLAPTSDEDRLAAFYRACDVFVSATEIGEAQGLAILEAMSLGVPVVTCSTPWADNAQIEFVEHGSTGLIANHPRSFGEAAASLLHDQRLRDTLGASAREMVSRTFDPVALGGQLGSLFSGLLEDGRLPAEWSPSPREVDGFVSEYARRRPLQYRRPRGRERLEVQTARFREKAAHVLRR